MNTILTETEGFTPVIDVLAQELGLMTAVVYGIVWRYCQMKDRVCNASRETIAEHARISTKTVERHLDKLCEAGYLKDLHPEWKHRPHIYADTGKLKIEALVKVKKGGTESLTSESGKTESPTRPDTKSNQGKTESLTRIPSYDSTDESKEEETLDFPETLQPVSPSPFQQGDDFLTIGSKCTGPGGNYAVPPPAGGSNAFRDGPVDAFCEVLADIVSSQLPQNMRRSWGNKLREIAKKCSTEDLIITPEIIERAIRAIPDDKIGWKTFSSPYSDNFEDNIIPLLLRGGQPRKKGVRASPSTLTPAQEAIYISRQRDEEKQNAH